MRDLIQGYIEHCEISRTLVGQIDRFVYHQGRKYGLPTFTVYGDPQPGLETCFVNVVAVNDDTDTTTAETLLQLIERIVLQPQLAHGKVLRILPVTNPVALEGADEATGADTLRSLDQAVKEFRQLPADGQVEIRLTDSEQLSISIDGPNSAWNALQSAEEALRRLHRENSVDDLFLASRRHRTDGPWKLDIAVPRSWSSALSVHWVSQVLIVFFRSHLEAQLQQMATTAYWDH